MYIQSRAEQDVTHSSGDGNLESKNASSTANYAGFWYVLENMSIYK